MRLLLSALALALLALPAAAEMPAAASARHAETRFGNFDVFDNGNGRQLVWRDRNQLVAGIEEENPSDNALTIRFVVGLAGGAADWMFLDLWDGGNDCSTVYHQLVMIDATGPHAGEVFGACMPDPRDMRLYPDHIEFDLDAPDDVTVAWRTVAFDGRNQTVTEHPAAEAGASTADPRRWVGRFPTEPFEDPAEVARFGKLLSAAEMNDLLAHMTGPGGNIIEQGGWVLGYACMAHNCGDAGAGWGLRVADGAVAVAQYDDGRLSHRWGLADDPVVAGFLASSR